MNEQQDGNKSSEDEFVININDKGISEEIVHERLKAFSHSFVSYFEEHIYFCLGVLTKPNAQEKSNSLLVKMVSDFAPTIPIAGTAIGTAFKEIEMYFKKRSNSKDSQCLADLIYYYTDNKSIAREVIIKASFKIFCCYEAQFIHLTCNGGPLRAMQKLAKNAVERIFNYLIKNEDERTFCSPTIERGVILGTSKTNAIGIETGHTLKHDTKRNWESNKLYTMPGIFIESMNKYYKNKQTKSDKYGFRRIFDWESINDVRDNWIVEEDPNYYKYILHEDVYEELFPLLHKYIISKDPLEEAQEDRDEKHQIDLKDRAEKYSQIMECLLEAIQCVESTNQTIDEKTKDIIETIEESRKAQGKEQNEQHQQIIESISVTQQQIENNHYETQQNNSVCYTEIKEKLSQIEQGQVVLYDVVKEKSGPSTQGSESVVTAEKVKEIVKENSDFKKIEREVKRIGKQIEETKVVGKQLEKNVRKARKKIFGK